VDAATSPSSIEKAGEMSAGAEPYLLQAGKKSKAGAALFVIGYSEKP